MDPYTVNLLGAFAIGCADAQDAAMAAVGLDPAELAALLAVHARPGSKVDDIALTTGLTHSGAVRVIDRLSRANWVERRAGRDRRAVAIHCSRKGHEKARLALALRRKGLQEAASGLTKAELAAFRRLARKFLARLPRHRPDAWRICRLCDHGVCTGSDCPVGSAVP
jgi:DNA-binding MarR family transcriptional regulator